ncbi:hypothetical protein MED92_09101 [Oceanospirillum sp. MED92]|uniref:diguanylate cyclase n=2 Tax=Neptuniibacter caesariensis TaxID=207954 RepID=A0A7U8GRT4_NEPCE|nr:hypothetical protein MED92_09101 [Oceanospirillum sp. MED92] [Neptuniibacter caesariensis]
MIIIVLVNIGFFWLFAKIDMLEKLVEFSEDHEDWELDEIIPVFFTMAVSLAYFAYSRWKEAMGFYRTAHRLSIRDSLTDLYNRRYFTETLQQEISNCNRSKLPFTLILIDLDDFKRINDTMGHETGDDVLVGFSQVLSKELRKSDTAARWGGEEFIILCRNTDNPSAQMIADKLLNALRKKIYPKDTHVTATMGITTSFGNETMEIIIKKADDCLYTGKSRGKNQAVFA